MTECGREKSWRNKYFFNDDKVEMQEKEVWEKKEKRERNRRRREGEEIWKDRWEEKRKIRLWERKRREEKREKEDDERGREKKRGE